ncbi:MAG: DUF5104 domain-containing protein [Clostridia bacterium]|nr:DUF5104 domain-containing protein [Clostridia bacterium]
MAFVSMIFVLLFFVLIFLGGLALVGGVLLWMGLSRRRKPEYAGKRSPKVLFGLGLAILTLPTLVVVLYSVRLLTVGISTAFQWTQYECIPDRWRNEMVSDTEAADDALNALLTSADNGDRDAFSKNFTPEIQADAGFQTALDDFFAAYPGGLADLERKGGYGGGGGSYDMGTAVLDYHVQYDLTDGDTWYRVHLSICYRNTDEPDKVGVTVFTVRNLPASAAYEEEVRNAPGTEDGRYMVCDVSGADGRDVRLIDGNPFFWTASDTPPLTVDALRELLAAHRRMDDPVLTSALGSPGAVSRYADQPDYRCYYELTSENGEPRYADIQVEADSGEIFGAFVCTPDETDYDTPLWDEEN